MTKYVLKRICYMVVVFFVVSILMYAIYNLIPSDPARAELEPLKKSLKPEEYAERYQQLRDEYGLDDPLIVRYARWMGFAKDKQTDTINGMLQGNLGQSSVYK